jgi:hypothetical protein
MKPGKIMPHLSTRLPAFSLAVWFLYVAAGWAGEIDFDKLKEKPDPFKDLPGVAIQEQVSNFGPKKYNCNSHMGFAKDSTNGLRKPVEIINCDSGDLTIETSRDLEN